MSQGLSQEEIDALLAGGAQPAAQATEPASRGLSPDESDTLGEIGNICMSSAATVLSSLLGQSVAITTPVVQMTTETDLRAGLATPVAAVSVDYTEGLDGTSVFLIPRGDAAVLADLMMGGDGASPGEELDPIRTSAVSEAMNQMMGGAATALAELLARRIDIAPPDVQLVETGDDGAELGLGTVGPLVRVSFDLRVGELLQTELMQLMPLQFAQDLVREIMARTAATTAPAPPAPPRPEAPDNVPVEALHAATAAAYAEPPPGPAPRLHAVPPPSQASAPPPVVQPVSFPALGTGPAGGVGADISLLLDVPLQVTVELGRTRLRIRNVLELVPGSIVELDKLAGEPVDVLVNGKQIARGEVVVIDEEFGVRITDVASRANRLRNLAEEE